MDHRDGNAGNGPAEGTDDESTEGRPSVPSRRYKSATEETEFRRRSVLRAVGVGLGVGSPIDRAAAAVGTRESGAPEAVTMSGWDLAQARNAFYSRQAVAGKTECFRPDEREIYGPTDVNAQTGNGRLSVALNDEGTVTVFRWPRPSFYDQVKYFTLDRNGDDDIEVLPNEGVFLGVALRERDWNTFETVWLRDMDARTQYYASDRTDTHAVYSDEVVTTYRGTGDFKRLGVTVRDLVTREWDALVRRVRVRVPQRVEVARLIAFENLNLVVSKHPQFPTQDWCTEETNQDRARYRPDVDAIVHGRAGVDNSTGEPRRVTVAMGFAGASIGHQVGGDAYEPAAVPAGRGNPIRDAYDDAGDLPLSGNNRYAGQTTGALVTNLDLGPGPGGTATGTVVLAAGDVPEGVTATLGDIRECSFREIRTAKETWLGDLLADAPLPDIPDDDPAQEEILELCRRALVTLVTDTEDGANRATVASIATQAPYGEDWPRDGAYFNYALDLVGLHGWVTDRARWYAAVQQRADDPRPSHPTTPPGNWAMNYYGDGVAGGPIPYEIDETGYGSWTLWDHYAVTGDAEYLADVYPAIRRAAEFLVECRDPVTGLHCPAWEDDRFDELRQTIVGAALVWKGLDAAVKATGEVVRAYDDDSGAGASEADRERYLARRDEVGRGIDDFLYDGTEGMYGARAGFPMAEVVWPVCFTPYAEDNDVGDRPATDESYDHPRIRAHLDTVWKSIAPTFEEPEAGKLDAGQYEAKGLVALAKARRESGPGSLDQVREGVRWLATRHATSDTRVMGEAWKVFEGEDSREVRSIVSQPHAWEQVLTYFAALEAWPPIDGFEDGTCGSVLEELRRRNAPE